MTLADPLGLAALSDQLKIADVKFALNWYQEMSGTGGGDTLYADVAPARWMADVTCEPQPHATAEGIMALLNSRAGGLKKLLLSNKKMPYPTTDPAGSIFGTATPVVGVVADSYHLSFTGFPNGYVLPLGTYFQIIFGSTRYYLGQFCEAVTANGSGAVASVEVSPPLPASVASGNAVTVKKPAGKFRVTPNTAYPSTSNGAFSTVTFSAEQTYAA